MSTSPSYINTYTPPPPPELPDPSAVLSSSAPYDINYALPLHLETLSSSTIRLTPFVPALHAQTLWAQAEPRLEDVFRYYPFYPANMSEFLGLLEKLRKEPEWCMFAVVDKTREGTEDGGALAGMMALINTSAHNLNTEIGFVMVLPAFQRTHVARTAVALLLRYCLELPHANPPGLGFRRVQWSAHTGNKPSRGLAGKMGFKEEGILRWNWVLPEWEVMAKVGKEVKRRGEEKRESYGRDSALLSVCWDDWEGGIRELVEKTVKQ